MKLPIIFLILFLIPFVIASEYGYDSNKQSIQNKYNLIINGSANHNDLDNIQGGSSTERYHLTLAQLNGFATNASYQFGYNNFNGSGNFTTTGYIHASNILKSINDTLGNNFTFVTGNSGYVNMTAFDSRYLSGGFKSFYFTDHVSGIAGMYNTTLYISDLHNTTTLVSKSAADGDNIIAQFISQPEPEYRVSSGVRSFYISASVDSIVKTVQLYGQIYTVNLTGGNKTLLRNSTLTIPLSLVEASYIMTSIGNVITIPASQRVLFEFHAIKEAGGANVNVTLYLEDATYSRLDVPSPVGVVDISNLVPYTGASKNIVLGNQNITTNGTTTLNNVIITGNLSAKRPYWTGYDNSTQNFTNTANTQVVNLSNNNDFDSYLISIVNQNITFKQTGDYIITFMPEFTLTTGTNKVITFWIQKNGVDVPWSNTRISLPTPGVYLAQNIVYQVDITNPETDYIRIMWWSDSTASQIVSISGLTSPTRPSIPGVLVNIYKSSEITP